jgi:hypothetical protein
MQRDRLHQEIARLNTGQDAEVSSSYHTSPKAGSGAVKARILWPALGFPAVINPRANATGNLAVDGDASKSICVLLVSDQKVLSKEDAAKYLRYVPWSERSRRHIPAGQTGSFAQTDLSVRSDVSGKELTLPGWKDQHGTGIAFGGNRDGENSIVVKLSDYVRNFYAKNGLPYLHEIRVYERASAQIKAGQYNLFWNADIVKEDAPSAEMKLLLDKYALPRRRSSVLWEKHYKFLLGEYEYEYGSLQKPYKSELQMREKRAEVLHPLFVQPVGSNGLKVGHVTDTHVDVRADVYAENLKPAIKRAKGQPKQVVPEYNNWNESFVKAYNGARKDADILLLTGDLVDYGRGHWGLTGKDKLGEDQLYHADRNWFLFYYLLSSGDAYQKPAYTILGNHDWRLNPYPPFAIAGAPGPSSFFHNHVALDAALAPKQEPVTRQLLKEAHGPGNDRKFTYHTPTDLDFIKKFWDSGGLVKTAAKIIAQRKTMDEPHLPVQTTVESIGWYLMAINPFLDYSFTLPGGQKVLMLDWAEDEDLFFQLKIQGKEWAFAPWQIKQATSTPQARNSFTAVQKKLVDEFAGAKANGKLIGIHTPAIGPQPDWSDLDLIKGRKVYAPGEGARVSKHYAKGHPFFAVLPNETGHGTVADYGSFAREREWFIKKMSDPKTGVRAIFSGHIHRDGLYVVHTPTGKDKQDPNVAGKMLVKSLLPPATSPSDHNRVISVSSLPYPYPLYINTTSAGPRGDFCAGKNVAQEKGLTILPGYSLIEMEKNGTISKVNFLSIK